MWDYILVAGVLACIYILPAILRYYRVRKNYMHLGPKERDEAVNKDMNPSFSTRNSILIIVAVIVFIIIIVLDVEMENKSNRPQPPAVTRTQEAPSIPAISGAWTIRLKYYDNDYDGESLVQNLLRFLNEKGINGVFTRNEVINNAKCIVIYQGKYNTDAEARARIPGLKKLHYAFKNACEVQIK